MLDVWVCGPVSLDGQATPSVLAQYQPSVRWNGWLCPSIDALSAVEILTWLNRVQPPEDTVGWRFDDDGGLWLDDHCYPDDPEEGLPPDSDGLYPLGAFGWVWTAVLPPEED